MVSPDIQIEDSRPGNVRVAGRGPKVAAVLMLGGLVAWAGGSLAAASVKRVQPQKTAANVVLRPVPSDIMPEAVKAVPLGLTEHEAVHYRFTARKWKMPFLMEKGIGGPFAMLNKDQLMLVSRCGTLAVVEMRGHDLILKSRAALPFQSEIHCDSGPDKVLSGVKGLLLTGAATGPRRTAYLSYTHEPTPGCTTLKLVRFDLALGSGVEIGDKTDIFVTAPCGPQPVIHNELGGVLAESGGHVYLSVGDFGHLRPAGAKSDFGRIYRFNAAQARPQPELYAGGLRNALGLAFAPPAPRQPGRRAAEPVLFASDMGPKGGDEINLVAKGDNLGFPRSSYGIEYGHDTGSDYAGQFDTHRFGKPPLYVFMPSVAPTGLAYYDGAMFRSWGHSLILTTLRGRTLYRLRLEGTRVVYAEPIAETKERMRTVVVAPDGSIIAKADPDVLIHVSRPGAKGE